MPHAGGTIPLEVKNHQNLMWLKRKITAPKHILLTALKFFVCQNNDKRLQQQKKQPQQHHRYKPKQQQQRQQQELIFTIIQM